MAKGSRARAARPQWVISSLLSLLLLLGLIGVPSTALRPSKPQEGCWRLFARQDQSDARWWAYTGIGDQEPTQARVGGAG